MKDLLSGAIRIAVFGIGAILISSVSAGTLSVSNLRCEYLRDPLGIDVARPRLSWMLHCEERGQTQSAYHIQVASAPEALADGRADLWESGQQNSPESIQIEYGGKPLRAGQTCYWRVKVWDAQGKENAWSEPARWEMGVLEAADWQNAQWIGDGKSNPAKPEDFYRDDPAPQFRKPFALSKPLKRARLYITGLGYYEAYLNGQRVGDRQLDPLWTTYSKRMLYSTYDVTRQVQAGENVVGVTLGNGWYNPLPMKFWGWLDLQQWLTVGRPCFIARLALEFSDGSRIEVVSDSSWKTAEGPLLRNNLYLGEVYDARREMPGWNRAGFDDRAWKTAVRVDAPGGKLRSQLAPPIRIVETIPTKKITQPKPGTFIYDFGQNFAGVVRLRVKAAAGTQIVMRFGELLNPDGTLNVMTSVAGQVKRAGAGGPGAPDVAYASDTYICRGEGEETYAPRFTFHGFRYVEVKGWPGRPAANSLEGLALCSDLESAGEFECSNELFNRIQRVCRNTFRSNLLGVQSDCPARERFGYGGDIAATSDALLLNYDMAAFYAKAVNDFADAADADGWLTETAPFVGIADRGFSKSGGPSAEAGFAGRSGPIGWTIAYPLLLRDLYRYYGDRRLVEEHYETARRYLELVRAKAPDHILTNCISDHEGLDPKPVAALATAHYYQYASLVRQLADWLGKKKDAESYAQLSKQIQEAFVRRFMSNEPGQVMTGTQGAQATGLFHDLIPVPQTEAAVSLLEQAVKQKDGHLATGIFGTKYLLHVLWAKGRGDLAYGIVNTEEFPGWGYMLKHGATTLWETWAFSDNVYSHNHPMFGSVSEWMFSQVGGLAPNGAFGCDSLTLAPVPSPALAWAKARYQSVRGPISTHWRVENGRFLLDCEIPPGVTANVFLPTTNPESAKEGGIPLSEGTGIKVLAMRENKPRVGVTIGSGRYTFSTEYTPAVSK